MLCAIYKSARKAQTYLFVKKRDDFSSVPEQLMKVFGTPNLVTIINLATKDKLGMADLEKVKTNLLEEGFYLQLPPPTEDLLKEHKAAMKTKQE
ncbi:YcgL domain-containing protein [Colwellia ponticola]|uniref:YcgL domain-containing protein FCS21_13775 n=1 Tax=Colwellia ponticola TaxID=2304625 RepID=A0A8H2JK05_9GAMM|nr:YcgL domain-containing protein [Colwellia ponticola]RGP39561.1 YcgL domain-containing protein [Altererythrobacter insulae]TMM42632.1 YcgL domain-containing protein [Colwellia ponticola]